MRSARTARVLAVAQFLAVGLLMLLPAASTTWFRLMTDDDVDPVPYYEAVPHKLLKDGGGQLAELDASAAGETILNRLFNTDCYSQALRMVQQECSRLDQETKNRLALAWANCHVASLGRRTYTCPPNTPLQACAREWEPTFYATQLEFLTKLDTVCLFLQNQDFERRTEWLLRQLYAGGAAAAADLGALRQGMGDVAGAMGGLEGAVDGLQAAHEGLAQQVSAGNTALAALREQASGLGQALVDAAAVQGQVLSRQGALLDSVAALDAAEAQRAQRAQAMWEAADRVASDIAAAQRQQLAAQQDLASDLATISTHSSSIRSALESLAVAQRRSEGLLAALLGRGVAMDDVAFYGAAAAAAWTVGGVPRMRSARLPLLLLCALCGVAERAALGALRGLLVPHPVTGASLLPLPASLPWLAGGDGAAARSSKADGDGGGGGFAGIDVKWLVRRSALLAAAAALVWSAAAYREYDKENNRLLRDIQAQQASARVAFEDAVKQALKDTRHQLAVQLQLHQQREWHQQGMQYAFHQAPPAAAAAPRGHHSTPQPSQRLLQQDNQNVADAVLALPCGVPTPTAPCTSATPHERRGGGAAPAALRLPPKSINTRSASALHATASVGRAEQQRSSQSGARMDEDTPRVRRASSRSATCGPAAGSRETRSMAGGAKRPYSETGSGGKALRKKTKK